jgi:DNA adenine methylase
MTPRIGIMTPAFGRVGSKAPMKKKVYSLMPKDKKVYVEPFVGGGAVFFGHDWGDTKVVLNDKDRELMSAYKILKKGFNMEQAKKYDSKDLNQLKQWYKSSGGGDLARLVKFRLKSNNTFGSLGRGDLYAPTSPYNMLKKGEAYKNKLKDVTLLSENYKSVMRRYDSPQTFFYLDPPYNDSKRLYKEGEFNNEELANFLRTIKGKFLLSMNDSGENRKIFKGFKIRGVSVLGGGHNVGDATGGQGGGVVGKGKRKELLISNY